MKNVILALATVLVSSSAFANDVCLITAQKQAASMAMIDHEVDRSEISLINVRTRKLQSGGNQYSVQTVVGNGDDGVPVEYKVKAFKNANGTCTTISIELGVAG